MRAAFFAIFTALFGGSVWAADSLYVRCPADLDALCLGLRDHLSPHSVRMLPPEAPHPAGALLLSFETTARSASMLRGRLVWSRADDRLLTGPELELSTMDAALPERELRPFAEALLMRTPSALPE